MGKVRHFRPEDIPQVIDLNIKLFPGSASLTRDRQKEIFTEVCFHNAWHDPEISSLVFEEDSGKISGFLGVIPHSVTFNGNTLRMAVSQHLMVDNVALGSLQLFKALLSGPQDITMTDMAVDVARKIWERLGGSTSFLHSIYWLRPLRPASAVFSYLMNRQKKTIPTALAPLVSGLDSLTSKFSLNPFKLPESNATDEELTIELFLECISAASSNFSFQPKYDPRSAQWLFSTLGKDNRFGTLRKRAVRNADGDVIGWYVYNLQPGGRSEVLQIGSLPGNINAIIRHVFFDAWKNGSIEIAGRLNTQYMKEYSEHQLLYSPGKNWMLVHSRDKAITNAIISGDAFLTRLEGDLWFF